MFSYFQNTPEPDLEQNQPNDAKDEPMPEGLSPVEASEKSALLSAITANKTRISHEVWDFRRGYGPREFMAYTIPAAILWIYCEMTVPGSPYGKADQHWLQNFCLLFIIWACIIHAAAYFPTPPCSLESMATGTRAGFSYAQQNFRAYHWCIALIAAVVLLYPIMGFYSVVMDGFDPYKDLSAGEKKVENDTSGNFFWMMRYWIHWGVLILIGYYVVMTATFLYIRKFQKYPGQYTWIAVRIGKLPLGAILFQEKFDCGICFQGNILIEKCSVVRCACNPANHIFHEECLRSQLVDHSNKYCVLCHKPIAIAPGTLPE